MSLRATEVPKWAALLLCGSGGGNVDMILPESLLRRRVHQGEVGVAPLATVPQLEENALVPSSL